MRANFRTIRRVTVLMVASSLLLQATSVVANASSYVYNCSGTKHTTHNDFDKDVTPQTYFIKGVLGDVTVINLNACNPSGLAFGSTFDIPWVFAANLQAYNYATSDIVQIGFGWCEVPSGDTCDPPADGKPHLVYTAVDNSSGTMTSAESWYHSIVVGHRYRMRILLVGCGSTTCWQYCVRDYNTNESYVCHTTTRHWSRASGGDFAWWGSETNNLNSQMGATDVGADFNMYYLQYLPSSSGAAWQIRTNYGVSCAFPDGQPNYYHCLVKNFVYTQDGLTTWTTTH